MRVKKLSSKKYKIYEASAWSALNIANIGGVLISDLELRVDTKNLATWNDKLFKTLLPKDISASYLEAVGEKCPSSMLAKEGYLYEESFPQIESCLLDKTMHVPENGKNYEDLRNEFLIAMYKPLAIYYRMLMSGKESKDKYPWTVNVNEVTPEQANYILPLGIYCDYKVILEKKILKNSTGYIKEVQQIIKRIRRLSPELKKEVKLNRMELINNENN